MARQYDYNCTNCGEVTARDKLTVKRITFLEMGAGARTKQSRVIAWLCPACLIDDEDFNREPHLVPVPEVKRSA
jgi:rubredoxin